MTMPTTPISVTTPIHPALGWVKHLLFRPFNLERWFTIGFCAWLAHLGRTGFNFHFNYQPRSGRGRGFGQACEQVRDYVLANLHWIIPLVAVAILAGLALWVLVTWLTSRGQFMFLHCVALNRAEIRAPWRDYAQPANSLFRFRLGLALVGLLPTVLLLVAGGLIVYRIIAHHGSQPADILALVATGVVLLVVLIVFGIIAKLTTDFVVPIMFLGRCDWQAGWGELLGLVKTSPGNFVVYLLFQIVLGLATGVLTMLAVLGTCCTAFCLLVIPYIGTVALLPVLVFLRSYSLLYLAQYGPQYNVFPPPPPPTVSQGAPTVL